MLIFATLINTSKPSLEMKRFYENQEDQAVFEIELDTDAFAINAWSGYLYQYHENRTYGKTHKVKQYKKLETAERNFEKLCKAKEAKGFVISDAFFPLKLKKELEYAKKFDPTAKKNEGSKKEAIRPDENNFVPTPQISVYDEKNFEEITKLTYLTRLRLIGYRNDIDIPESLSKLKNLSFLELGGFRNLPENIGDLKKLEHFCMENYANSSTTKLPASLANCTKLASLDISDCTITDLPENIGKLKNLKELDVSCTDISHIPASIGQCKNLESIEASECTQLLSLPDEFGDLTNLKELTFWEAHFKKFPEVICKLKNLEKLDLSTHKFSKIPDSIGNLKSLKDLDLSNWSQDGKLKELPDALFDLTNLETLNVGGHKLTEIPDGLRKLTNLHTLNFSNNPIKFLPIKVLHNKAALFKQMGFDKDDAVSVTEKTAKLKKKKTNSKKAAKDEKNTSNTKETVGNLSKLGAGNSETTDISLRYKESVAYFMRCAQKSWVEDPLYSDIQNYLLCKTDKIPKIIDKKWYFYESPTELAKLFSPISEWSNTDDRLMHFLIENIWGKASKFIKDSYDKKGYSEAFFRWYATESKEGREPEYKDVFAILEKYEQASDVFYEALTYRYDSLVLNGEASNFGKVVIQEFNKDADALFTQLRKEKEIAKEVIDFLIQYDLKNFEKKHEDWFFDKKLVESKKVSFEPDNVRALVRTNPKKYEDFLLKVADLNRYTINYVQFAIDIHAFYGMKHKDRIAELALDADFEYLLLRAWKFSDYRIPDYKKGTPVEYLDWLATHFKAETLPYVLPILTEKPNEMASHYEILLKHYDKEVLPVFAKILEQEINVEKIIPLLKDTDYKTYHSILWTLLESDTKNNRIIAAAELTRLYKNKDLLKKIPALLESKKTDSRDGGVRLLVLLKDKEATNLLEKQLSIEQQSSIRELIIEHLKQNADKGLLLKNSILGFETMKEKGKLDKPAKKWLDVKSLPDLYWKDGKKMEPMLIRYLFQKQKAKVENWFEPSEEVQIVLNEIDTEKSGDFANELLKQCSDNGGIKAANKIMLPIAAFLGDDRVAETLKKYCISKNNVLSANLLGNLKSDKAARALDTIMIQYRVKYPNIREAASNSFDKIAKKMGLSRLELMDKMIPDFGFENMFKPINIGEDSEPWRAFINADLKLSFLNELDEIKKKLPTKIPKELKDEIKAINKEIRTIAKQQKLGLELNFIAGRKWTSEEWQKHFMGKPLMFAFAQSLIWGVYEKAKTSDSSLNYTLIDTFGINEDQTLENVEFDEIELPENKYIGMVHPIELEAETVKSWQSYIEDNKLKPAFPQIDRKVFMPRKDQLHKTVLHKFDGRKIKAITFKNNMEKRYWKRGSVQDAGGVASYRKAFEAAQIEVFIGLEYMNVQIWDYDEETTLEELYFTKLNSIKTGNYEYDTYKGENDSRLIKLGDLPAIVYSETMYDFYLLLGEF